MGIERRRLLCGIAPAAAAASCGVLLPALKTGWIARPGDSAHKIGKANVKKFHVAAGHPGVRDLARMIRDAGRSRWQQFSKSLTGKNL